MVSVGVGVGTNNCVMPAPAGVGNAVVAETDAVVEISVLGAICAALTLPLMIPTGSIICGPVNSAGRGTLCVGVAVNIITGIGSGEPATGVRVGSGVQVGVGGREVGCAVEVGVRVAVATAEARRVGVRVAICANAPDMGCVPTSAGASDCACAEAWLLARQKKRPVVRPATSSARAMNPGQEPALARKK